MRFSVRIDVSGRAVDLRVGGRELSLEFVSPAGVRFSVRHADGGLAGAFWDRLASEPHWIHGGPGGATVAAGTILALAIPLADLGVQLVAFFVGVYDEAGAGMQRHPADRPIELRVPDRLFEARHWRA